MSTGGGGGLVGCAVVRDLLEVMAMVTKQVLRAASGWLELGMPDDALEELGSLPEAEMGEKKALELKLSAEMAKEDWNAGAVTAGRLCVQAVDDPDYFLSAAFCLHETGDTEAARKCLLTGPAVLHEMPVFHYNMACYLWTLGEGEPAKGHLARAVEMDEGFLDAAKVDRDLVGMEI